MVVTPLCNILPKPPISLPTITDQYVISLEIDLSSKLTVKIRTVYIYIYIRNRYIKYINFELFSDNIKTNFHNKIPSINSLKLILN